MADPYSCYDSQGKFMMANPYSRYGGRGKICHDGLYTYDDENSPRRIYPIPTLEKNHHEKHEATTW